MTPPATYLYCIVSSRRPLSTTRTPAGPPGTGPVRALEVRPHRYAIVSDAPVGDFGERPLARRLSNLDWVSRAAVAHEAVIASFLPRAEAVVPMKLFTLFTSDARTLAQLRSESARIGAAIRRLAGHDEWGVRLVYDDTRAPAPLASPRTLTGRAYLLAKRRQQHAARAHTTGMRRIARDVLTTLRPFARETRRRDVTDPAGSRSRLLLDAALLVPRAKADRLRRAVEREARTLAPGGYILRLSGPWPGYSFAGTS